jgi:flagella basal body P-ring formation protein FlgA
MLRATALFTLLVAMLAAGAVLAQSVTPIRAIRSKAVLAPEDLALAEETVPGAIAAIEDAVGLEAKVALYPGRPILASQLGAPALVERNALVRMSYVQGALRIVTEGRALDRAAAGEAVRVMNLASRQTVTGTVAPDGSIEVAP